MLRFKFDKTKLVNAVEKLTNALKKPKSGGLWSTFDKWLSDIVNEMFKNGGGKYGVAPWPPISSTIYGKARRNSSGNKSGVYGPGNKPLDVSGKFKNSFGAISDTESSFIYGSRHPKADVIPYGGWQTGRGPRHVLPDPNSSEFKSDMRSASDKWIHDAIRKTMRGN